MTKPEFKDQFKRLRVAGYRLPISDGITVDDVMSEWFGTFGACTVSEFSQAIDRLKEKKTDTFWPATGELWFLIREIRKGNAIRRSAREVEGAWSMSDADARDFLALLRETRDKILKKHAMPAAAVQVPPQDVTDEELLRDEDSAVNNGRLA